MVRSGWGGHDLFRGISPEDIGKIKRYWTERTHVAGTLVYSAGEASNAIYILDEGLVKIVSISEGGTEAILDIVKPMDIFGELALTERKRRFTAIIQKDSRIVGVLRKDLLKIFKYYPPVSVNFIRILAKKIKKIETDVVLFSYGLAYQRLGMLLLNLSDNHGIDNGISWSTIPFRLTHEELARMIGTTRETVSSQMKRFREMGFLKRKGKKLSINRTGLRGFLHS